MAGFPGLLDTVKTTRVKQAVAAGATDFQTDSVSQVGFRNVAWDVAFGTITAGAVTSVKAQQSVNDSVWEDVEGSSQTVTDAQDNLLLRLEILGTENKFYRLHVDRATQNAVVDSIVAHQSGAGVLPITASATTFGNLQLVDPVAGTA